MKHIIKVSSIFLFAVLIFSNCSTNEMTMALPDEVTYTSHISDIISNNCATCHGNLVPSAGLALTSYDAVRQSAETGSLLSYIEDSNDPMPPSGLLPDRDIQLIKRWAEQGFEE